MVVELVCGHDVGGEADLVGRLGVDVFAGEQQFQRLFLVDSPHDRDQRLRGEDADIHLGRAEGGLVGGDDDVTGRGEAHPAGQTVALDSGDGECARVDSALDEVFHAGKSLAVGLRALPEGAGHRLGIAARAEGALGTADHDDPDIALVCGLERVQQAADDVLVERVAVLVPVDCRPEDEFVVAERDLEVVVREGLGVDHHDHLPRARSTVGTSRPRVQTECIRLPVLGASL